MKIYHHLTLWEGLRGGDLNIITKLMMIIIYTNVYSKTCVKRPLKNRQNKDLNDKW